MTIHERRTCERFSVPGATVEWHEEADADAFGSESRLADLSRGGMRFLTPSPPRLGASLLVRLTIPGEPLLPLRGRAVWSAASSGQFHSVAVAFAPFGDEAGDLSPSVLARLIAIEERFKSPRA